MHPFAYLAPTTVKEAVDVLTEYGDKARPLAGGTDLLVKARANVWELDAVVDVKNIPELNTINFDKLDIVTKKVIYKIEKFLINNIKQNLS